jgi:uncharacterized protein (DUF305 family)
MKIQKKYALAGSFILGAALLTTAACSNVTVTPAPAASASANGMMNGGSSSNGMMGSDDASGGMMNQGIGAMMDADVMFLEMMIPHHQQAVEMSKLAATNGASPAVQKLADTIAAAQGPEIEQMQSWLDDSGAGSMMGNHSGHMAGVLSDEAMSELKAAQGADFDRLYLQGMIGHHEGAVAMAQDVIDNGENPTVIALAKKIIDAQTAEIAQMKQMLGQ